MTRYVPQPYGTGYTADQPFPVFYVGAGTSDGVVYFRDGAGETYNKLKMSNGAVSFLTEFDTPLDASLGNVNSRSLYSGSADLGSGAINFWDDTNHVYRQINVDANLFSFNDSTGGLSEVRYKKAILGDPANSVAGRADFWDTDNGWYNYITTEANGFAFCNGDDGGLTAAICQYLYASGGALVGPSYFINSDTMLTLAGHTLTAKRFYFGGYNFVGVNSDGTDNYVYRFGVNTGPSGASLDNTKPSQSLAFETDWRVAGVRYMEGHWSVFTPAGVEKRLFSHITSYDLTSIDVSFQANRHSFRDNAGTSKLAFDHGTGTVWHYGMNTVHDVNNTPILQQRNSAGTGYNTLIYSDSSDRTRLDGGQQVYLPNGGVIVNNPLIVNSQSNEMILRNGTTGQKLTVQCTYTSASNYEQAAIVATGGNPYEFRSEVGATGSHRGLNVKFDSVVVTSTGTASVPLIVRQASGSTQSLIQFQDSSSATGVSVSANGKVLSINNSALGAVGLNVFASGTGTPVVVQSNNLTNNIRMIDIVASASAVTGTVFSTYAIGNSTGAFGVYQQQNGSGPNQLHMLNVGAGNIQTRLEVNGGTIWTYGLNRSDSNAFVISCSGTLGTNNAIRIGTSQDVTFAQPVGLPVYTVGTLPTASAWTNDIAIAGGQIYISTGSAWVPFVRADGATFTGPVVLNADPTSDLQAATKRHVDRARTSTMVFSLRGL